MEAADVDALLDRHRERFRRLLRAIAAEEAGPDPFSYPLAAYRQLSDGERADLVRRAGTIARDRIDAELARRGAAWLILLGDRIVASSADVGSIPDPAAVLALGEAADRVAYLFEAPTIEEIPSTSAWAPLGLKDAYPTIPIGLLAQDEPIVIEADLDTGAHATLLDAAFGREGPPTWFEGRHLGQPFLWSPALVGLRIRGETGATIERPLAVRFVRDWPTSPFTRINARRRALAGRDLLRAFGLTIRLVTPDAKTTIVSGD